MSLKSLVEKIPGYDSLVLPMHFLRAVRAARRFRYPARGLRVVAVTGTNGKTTTSFMVWKMLNEAGRKCGVLSTVGWGGVGGVGEFSRATSSLKPAAAPSQDAKSSSVRCSTSPRISSEIISPTGAEVLHPQFEHMTTERVEVLNERMRKIADAGAEFLVLETTSHALAQFRTYGVPIEVAVLTNVTEEHLDYHKTFARYRKAKGKLFRRAKFSVINADDKSAEWFKKYASGEIITYGIEGGEVRATEVELGASGVSYSCGDMKIRTQIPGKFNVYNSLAAVAVGKCFGLSNKEIEDGIFALETVEGRMTRVREGQEFEVIVDYAHTPDAIEKVFESIRGKLAPTFSSASSGAADEGCGARGGRIIAVHGGAGRRDHATRAPRGEILGRESDVVIITEDDTRDEDLQEVMRMFVEGAERAGKVLGEDLFMVEDREEAIRKAIEMARKGDIVLILGKGHEKTILRGEEAVPFEDIEVARRVLRGA